MGRIFDAIQRDHQGQPNGRRDPLADTLSGPEVAHDQEIELPEMIGAPTAPRSNQGGVFSYLSEDFLQGERTAPHPTSAEEISFPPPHLAAPERRPAPVTALTPVQPRPEGQPRMPVRGRFSPPQTDEPTVKLTLHLDSARVHPRLIAVTEPYSIVSEQYRTLRTQIFHEAERRLTQAIVVTSAIAGEGKTSTSLNLAWTIANSKGRRVLLIDSDLRRPSVASYLGIAPALGFSEVLSGDCSPLDPVIRVQGKSNSPDLDENYQLYIMPARGEARNPTELLSGETLGDVLGELRQYFDFIILDSPPVTPFADARLLSNHSDGVLMVIRSSAAPYSTVERAIEALSPSRMLGVVLNGAKEDEDEGYYYEYYYTDNKRAQQLPSGLRRLAHKLGFFKNKKAGKVEPQPLDSALKPGADE